jgi:hypothetical protein
MSILVPQIAFAPTLFGGATGTASFATLPAAGNAVIVKIGLPANPGNISSISDNQTGNTYTLVTGLNNVGSAADYIYWCSSIGTPSGTFTVSVTTSSGSPQVAIMEVSGLSGAVDVASDSSNTALTSFTMTNSSVNANANDLVVAGISLGTAFGATATSLTTPPTSSYTVLMFVDGATSGAPDNGTSAGYKIVSALETSAASWSWTAGDSNPSVATIATFKGASVAPNTASIAWVK